MVVPARLLAVTYMFDKSTKPKLFFLEGKTTRKL
jgi:hypothetical protein